tara:strand:+ start:162 stop:371 length:210 start_codon:yes stop_codon:yes gene_type:complete
MTTILPPDPEKELWSDLEKDLWKAAENLRTNSGSKADNFILFNNFHQRFDNTNGIVVLYNYSINKFCNR